MMMQSLQQQQQATLAALQADRENNDRMFTFISGCLGSFRLHVFSFQLLLGYQAQHLVLSRAVSVVFWEHQCLHSLCHPSSALVYFLSLPGLRRGQFYPLCLLL
jgi:hypothetical protein